MATRKTTETEAASSVPRLAGRGGPGRGQGRKPSVTKALITRAEASRQKALKVVEMEEQIALNWDMLLARMLELADGVAVQEVDKEGTPHVYTRPPDRDAIKYLMDRFMGRIPDRKDMIEVEGQAETQKGPSMEELLHKVALMILSMHQQQSPPPPVPLPQTEDAIEEDTAEDVAVEAAV